jgi:hypothetical protein
MSSFVVKQKDRTGLEEPRRHSAVIQRQIQAMVYDRQSTVITIP